MAKETRRSHELVISHLRRIWDEAKHEKAAADLAVSFAICSCYVCVILISPLQRLMDIFGNYDKALVWLRLTNDVCGLTLHGFPLLMWDSLLVGARKTPKTIKERKRVRILHKLMAKGISGQSFLPGGFAPRFLTLAMGLVLFVNQNLVLDQLILGKKFAGKEPVHWDPGYGCVASSELLSNYKTAWFSRLHRKAPVGCFGDDQMPGGARPFFQRPGRGTPNLVHPFVTSNATLGFGGAVAERKVDSTLMCWYTCAKWRSLSIQGLLMHGGVILAGGVFIERLVNLITSRGGFKFVTKSSNVEDIRQAAKYMMRPPPPLLKKWRRSVCILVFVFIEGLVTLVVPRLDKDGYYTVDYYVTYAFILTCAIALIFRNLHPSELTPMIFTKNLWVYGKDTFATRLSLSGPVEIDLYDWFHIPASMKVQLLCDYAREIDIDVLPLYQPGRHMNPQTQQLEHPKEPAPAPATGSLEERLLRLSSRLEFLEGGGPPGGAETSGSKAECSAMQVRCINAASAFTDCFVADSSGSSSGTYMRLRVLVCVRAMGNVIGKTRDGEIVVDWVNDDTVHVKGARQEFHENNVARVTLAVPHSDVIEYGSDWHKCQDELEKYQDHYTVPVLH